MMRSLLSLWAVSLCLLDQTSAIVVFPRASSALKQFAFGTGGVDTLLSSQGEWQAYFEAQEHGRIYYFNVQTRESTWEAPQGFDVPSLNFLQQWIQRTKQQADHSWPDAVALEEQQDTQVIPSLLDHCAALASSCVSQMADSYRNSNDSQQDQGDIGTKQVIRVSNWPCWDDGRKFMEAAVDSVKSCFSGNLRSQSTPSEILKQLSDDEYDAFLTRKRLAASRARQANLRKNYGRVIENRYSTISLSSTANPLPKEWDC